MATLTETAYYARRGLALAGVVLVGFIVIRISFNLTRKIWLTLNPPPPPLPTVAFGRLPKLTFPEQETNGITKLTYRLETIGGGLPSLPDVGNVYFMPIGKPNLLALERATQRASKMGFTSQPLALNEIVYRWTNERIPLTTLEMNIYTGSFHLRYPYENDLQLLTEKNLPSNQEAVEEAKSFLRKNKLLTEELEGGRTEFSYWSLTATGLVPAVSLSEADFVRVDIFRIGLDKLNILPPEAKKSLISFLFSGAKEARRKTVEIEYSFSPIEKETSSTYPLKTVSTAWQELQGGEGYIAYFGQNKNGQITIRGVSLAYYESPEPQNYLQPIYVFEGDQDFFAYLPAIAPEWTE